MDRYSTGSDAVGLTQGYYDTRQLPIYEYLKAPSAPRYGVAGLPPKVTTRRPSVAKDQPSAPVYEEHRDPLEPVQNWFEPSTLPMVLSFDPLLLRHDTLFRNTEVPASNEKLRLPLSMLMLFDTEIVPGLLL